MTPHAKLIERIEYLLKHNLAGLKVNVELLNDCKSQLEEDERALRRLYQIVKKEMGSWLLEEGIEDELRDAIKEAKQTLGE